MYHFSAIFAWEDFFRFEFEIIEEQLCVFAFQGGKSFLYLPPLASTYNHHVVEECFKRMGKSPIARVENILQNQLPAFTQSRYNHYLKAHEYVYKASALRDLSGHAYKSKRHDVHVFLKHYPTARFRKFREEDNIACAYLYDTWAQQRREKEPDPVYVQMLDENARVHTKLIAHANALGLIGRVVELDGDIVGYTFGFKLNEITFCICLEVVDLSKAGLAAYIFNNFVKDPALLSFEWINTMDDFGMPNVAKAKASYHPAHMVPIYNVKENECTSVV